MKWTSHMPFFTLYEAFRVCLNFKLKFTYHSVATKHIFRHISYLEKLYKTSFTLDKYFVKLQKKKPTKIIYISLGRLNSRKKKYICHSVTKTAIDMYIRSFKHLSKTLSITYINF